MSSLSQRPIVQRLWFVSYSSDGACSNYVAQDSALMRPGRLDRILYVGPPDLAGREEIFTIRTRKMAVDPNLNLSELAVLV